MYKTYHEVCWKSLIVGQFTIEKRWLCLINFFFNFQLKNLCCCYLYYKKNKTDTQTHGQTPRWMEWHSYRRTHEKLDRQSWSLVAISSFQWLWQEEFENLTTKYAIYVAILMLFSYFLIKFWILNDDKPSVTDVVLGSSIL